MAYGRFLTAVLAAPILLAGLSGCYYLHVAGGQMDLLQARVPIARILADPGADAELKRRLARVRLARLWAVTTLGLPDNASYTGYADLHRDEAVYNVLATPEFSLAPRQECFLVVGCLAYQGYFRRDLAERRAAELRDQGYDVHVGGAVAYSTLGWFDDPVLNGMLRWSDAVLLETLFHELAHQQLFIDGDTRFNESYAEFVGQQGLQAWRQAHPQDAIGWDARLLERQRQFRDRVLTTRAQLEALYAEPLAAPAMRARKAEILAALVRDHAALRDGPWGGWRGYEAWFAEGPLNNARLLPFGLYEEDVPAFAQLFEASGRDWRRFHAAARELSRQPPAARAARLAALKAMGAPAP
ncbi:MAG TPA: aminopeptidase [Solimonas sp.]|nr:aminopeptidase [Solimonas sp.]